jgi:hypothetical protein
MHTTTIEDQTPFAQDLIDYLGDSIKPERLDFFRKRGLTTKSAYDQYWAEHRRLHDDFLAFVMARAEEDGSKIDPLAYSDLVRRLYLNATDGEDDDAFDYLRGICDSDLMCYLTIQFMWLRKNDALIISEGVHDYAGISFMAYVEANWPRVLSAYLDGCLDLGDWDAIKSLIPAETALAA